MSERSSRSARHFFGGTGFYIALFLVATALAVAGYWTMLNPSAPESAAQETETEPAVLTPVTLTPAPEPAQETEPEPAPVVEPEPEPAVPAEAPVALPEPRSEPVKSAPPRLIVAPLTGETVAAFSVDYPVFNPTMGDWRTHDGVDIAAAPGTQVLAACAGTVREVRDDDLMGTSVVIAHDGGYETIYANLQAEPAVVETQYVSAGQVIGAVGATALAECASAPHLHFAVTKDGAAVDPEAFLRS